MNKAVNRSRRSREHLKSYCFGGGSVTAVVICTRKIRIANLDEADVGKHIVQKQRGWRPLLLCLWLALIFGTSCTVIRPNEFFSLVARFTGAGDESMQRFAVFWGLCWFAIVKGWHFTEFVILTLLTAAAVKWRSGRLTVWSIIGSMLFCIAFAASDEWHQTFVPDRFGTVQDILIDSLGVLAAGATLLWRLNGGDANNKALDTERRTTRISNG